MARNGNGSELPPVHHCMQAHRLLRIEADLAMVEARRREDMEKTTETLKGMVSELNNALSFFTSARKQIKLLFSRMNTLTKSLENGRSSKARPNGKKRCPQ